MGDGSLEDPGDSDDVVAANCDGRQGVGPVVHQVEESIMGRKIYIIDVAVASGDLK